MTSLTKQALSLPWPIPKLALPAHSSLEKAAEEIARRFGGVPKEEKPIQDDLKALRALLADINGDLSRMPLDNLSKGERRQLKALPWILWDPQQRWSELPNLIRPYLRWADEYWRISPKRLWRHYLLNLNPQSYATNTLALWLMERQDRLTEPLRRISDEWRLFEPAAAIDQAATALLRHQNLLERMEQLEVPRNDVLGSSFLLRVLVQAGGQLQNQPAGIAALLKRILKPLGEQPTLLMQGPRELQVGAQKALVEGVVAWATPQPAYQKEALDFIQFAIGDPRLHSLRWRPISESARQTVEGWLTRITLDAFFRVMRELKTDRDDMVQEREVFWRGYQHAISRAWLIVAINGKYIAKRLLDKSFGEFIAGAQSDHCGLLMQVRDLVILEMNKVGSTLFWSTSAQSAPSFYQQGWQYNRAVLLHSYGLILKHQGDWQTRYENEILRLTGVRPER